MGNRPLDLEYHTARLILLIDDFTNRSGSLDGLTKLAKLDFLVRYPGFLHQFLTVDGHDLEGVEELAFHPEDQVVESRMIRYKYGPWDDSYYPLIGSLLARSLVEQVPGQGRIALRTTDRGRTLAALLRREPTWNGIAQRCQIVARHYNIPGSALKDRIYEQLPEVIARPIGSEI